MFKIIEKEFTELSVDYLLNKEEVEKDYKESQENKTSNRKTNMSRIKSYFRRNSR
ncbi:hypothetical protein [Fusobacterium sp.]|uniref:hypothetical protein n=1 Tax=Fusobacterium sp. TaxID=68766 RepID=UPI002626ADDC|nr:hypothetical protein [Fusobacterium sp.]